MQCLKPCSHIVVTSVDWMRFNFQFKDFFEQFAFVNNHLLCYWPTIHNLISKIYPKFQVISPHFFEVNELSNEQWAKIVQSENISTPIHVECKKMHQSKVYVQEFWYFVANLCLTLIFNLSSSRIKNDNYCMQKAVAGDKTLLVKYPVFLLIDTNSWFSG